MQFVELFVSIEQALPRSQHAKTSAPVVWDGHWDCYDASAEKNPAQAYRRRIVRRLLGAGPGARILDIGSGQGDQAVDILATWPKAEVLGLELSTRGVEIASAKAPAAHFLQIDLATAQVAPPEYRLWASHAVCAEVLEHVEDPVELLINVREFLQPGCRLVVTVPGGVRSAFDIHIGHWRHYRPMELRSVLEAAGFTVELAVGAGFPFFNLYRRVVVLRGERLISEVSGDLSTVSKIAMRAFGVVFHVNLPRSPWGQQTVAVATC